MKIRIEADLALDENEILSAVAEALKKPDVLQLMECVGPGEHFQIAWEIEAGKIFITKM